VPETTETTQSQELRKTQLNGDETSSKSTKNTEPNLTVPAEKRVYMARAVRIFHTLKEEHSSVKMPRKTELETDPKNDTSLPDI
tara:strand:+ start:3443 stop:3694 length:252 start_codon:yes stop_codon:yes gene_type:complete